MNVYRQYLKNQTGELVRDYHTNILWFDGEWEDSWTHADGMGLYAYAGGWDRAAQCARVCFQRGGEADIRLATQPGAAYPGHGAITLFGAIEVSLSDDGTTFTPGKQGR